MDFRVPEDLQALRRSFGDFLAREVRPVEESLAEQIARDVDAPEVRSAALRLRRRSASAGFYAPHLPTEVGGQGLSTLGTALLVEDAGASGLALAQALVGPPDPAAPSPVLLEAQPHVRDHYLGPMLRGETGMCFALTEPEAGSDAQAITTRATRVGDGWRLDGGKHYITAADEAAVALTFARVQDGDDRGITAFLVPRDQYEVVRRQWTMADTHPYELRLDDARVPGDHVVGPVGQGFATAVRFLVGGRAFIGASCVGIAEHCLQAAVAHARTRTAFGRPLSHNQGVAFPLADSAVEIAAARLLVRELACRVDDGEVPLVEASIVKLQATEMAFRVADRALQVFGGAGLMRESAVQRMWRHLRVLRIVEGASEVQRLVIARSLGL